MRSGRSQEGALEPDRAHQAGDRAAAHSRHNDRLYGTAQHSTAQHGTAQHSTIQRSTAQHNRKSVAEGRGNVDGRNGVEIIWG